MREMALFSGKIYTAGTNFTRPPVKSQLCPWPIQRPLEYRGLRNHTLAFFCIFEQFTLNSFEWIVLLNILYWIFFWANILDFFLIEFWIESFLGPMKKQIFKKDRPPLCWPCLTAPWDLRSRTWQREDRTCDKNGAKMTNQRLFNRPWTTQDTPLPPSFLLSLSRPTSTATHICRALVAGVYVSITHTFCS